MLKIVSLELQVQLCSFQPPSRLYLRWLLNRVLLLHWLAKRIWRRSSCFHLFDCALHCLLCYLATKWLYLQDTSKKVNTSQVRYYDENLSTTCLDLLLSSRWTKARVIPWTMSFVELTKYLSIHLSRNKWWKKKKTQKSRYCAALSSITQCVIHTFLPRGILLPWHDISSHVGTCM